MSIKTTPGKYPEKLTNVYEGQFMGGGWKVWEDAGTYHLKYLSGEMVERIIHLEISQEAYLALRQEKITLDEYLINRGK